MYRQFIVSLLLFICGFSCQVIAQESDRIMSGEALVQYHFCYSCHDAREALLGPPWQAIAARHSPRREIMVAVLSEKIRSGGGGNWGVVPMVPNEHVPEEDARRIAEWILNLSVTGN